MSTLPTTAKPSARETAFTPFQLMLLSLMVVQNCAVVLLGRYSQAGVAAEDKFSVKTLVALTEAMKLFACVILIGIDNIRELNPSRSDSYLPDMPLYRLITLMPSAVGTEISKILANPKNSMAVSPPAALYLFQNNILYLALENLSAPVFQVCYQSKLVTTAIVSVLLLNRKYEKIQWISLVLLGIGVSVVVLGEQDNSEGDGGPKDQNLTVGLIAVGLASLSSAFAGVYFEKVVKGKNSGSNGKPTSLWVRNVELAFFSLVFSFVFGIFSEMFATNSAGDLKSEVPAKPFLHGFTATTYALIFLQAGGGLLVAAIVKYIDNVVKGLATGVAVVVSTTFSCLFLGTEVKYQFALGGITILASVWAFSNHEKVAKILRDR
ncbi:hypothetical protein TrVE_jg8700 [Triparma verrucosa]|jgi:UDP-sugar transporter A1/2/3|uniref:UDP-galactose transporter n=1 Tax=Triparma verrucosa TaxID=1606542 RepID=A0A9W7B375_9STRA|nr:hypothetical protein TrVE_jg8700 [Triparma verrucosa]|mmetsp:Transcript_16636/g.31096  ORF Transcript_16636/g.31096 Transcript_16636/m.31096 type:complete len:379 (-) Transcript_16636:80-1216(-)